MKGILICHILTNLVILPNILRGAWTTFPCACYGWTLPGVFEDPTDSETIAYLASLNMTSVEEWELEFGDLSYGDYGDGSSNVKLEAIGYMYTQKLDFDASFETFGIKTIATNEPYLIDYETLFLHFSEDTTFILDDPDDGSSTSLFGFPYSVGYTQSATHSGYWLWTSPPWENTFPWQNWYNDGCVFVFHSEPFTSIELTLNNTNNNIDIFQNFSLTIEYPISVNNSNKYNKHILEWGSFGIVTDETNNLTNNGSSMIISWNYPNPNNHSQSWKPGATYNIGTKEGQYFGQHLLLAGADLYVIKLVWEPKNDSYSSDSGIDSSIKGPQLIDLRLTTWIEFNEYYNVSTIPGWDEENDLDHDGWVNNTEFNMRMNKNCSARFKHESRVVPMGNMWSSASSWCRINPWVDKDIIGGIWQDYLYSEWNTSGLAGAYNDDMLKLVGSEQFHIIEGGFFHEYTNFSIQDDNIVQPYTNKWAENVLSVLSKNDSYRIAGNVGATNLFVNTQAWNAFLGVLNTIMREEYVTVSVGFTGYFGIAKAWDTFVFGQMKTQQLIQIQLTNGRITYQGKTQTNYQVDITTALAIYYLLNVPNVTCLNIWGSGFQYGSDNTVKDFNYYKSGVPKNIAYQPTAMLQIDIGIPITELDELNQVNDEWFITYQVKTTSPLSDYTVIGNSSSTQLYHSEISDSGYLDIIPSYIYFAWDNGDWLDITQCATDMVLSRQYTKGLILYRTNRWGGQSAYIYNNDGSYQDYVNILLNDTYQIVRYNGSLSEPVTNVSIRPYEGIVLRKAFIDPTQIPTSNPITNPPTSDPSMNPSLSPISTPTTIQTTKWTEWTPRRRYKLIVRTLCRFGAQRGRHVEVNSTSIGRAISRIMRWYVQYAIFDGYNVRRLRRSRFLLDAGSYNYIDENVTNINLTVDFQTQLASNDSELIVDLCMNIITSNNETSNVLIDYIVDSNDFLTNITNEIDSVTSNETSFIDTADCDICESVNHDGMILFDLNLLNISTTANVTIIGLNVINTYYGTTTINNTFVDTDDTIEDGSDTKENNTDVSTILIIVVILIVAAAVWTWFGYRYCKDKSKRRMTSINNVTNDDCNASGKTHTNYATVGATSPAVSTPGSREVSPGPNFPDTGALQTAQPQTDTVNTNILDVVANQDEEEEPSHRL